MLNEKDIGRIKYLIKQNEILKEFDEYIDYLIKLIMILGSILNYVRYW